MIRYLVECFLTGLFGFLAIAAVGVLTFELWPYSGYVWGGMFFVAVCTAVGMDARAQVRSHGLGGGR